MSNPRTNRQIDLPFGKGVFAIFVGLSVTVFATHLLGQEVENPNSSLERILTGRSPRNLNDLVALQERIHKLSPALIEKTVAVQVGRANGSGVIVSKDGYVLTAAHVAGTPDRKAIVYLSDGRQVQGITLGLNEVLDAGLLKITEPGDWPHAELGKSGKLKDGQWCLATGHPGGYDPSRKPTLRMGRILKAEKSAILTDCTLVGGDSGGPLFDLSGNVIGIHSRIGKNLTVNVHVPVDRYRKSWSRLVKGEAWDLLTPQSNRNWIGVIQDTNDTSVVRIKKVTNDSPAETAGILPGDEVVRFGDIQIPDFEVLKKEVQLREPGERVSVLVRRSGQLIELALQIGLYPEREIGK